MHKRLLVGLVAAMVAVFISAPVMAAVESVRTLEQIGLWAQDSDDQDNWVRVTVGQWNAHISGGPWETFLLYATEIEVMRGGVKCQGLGWIESPPEVTAPEVTWNSERARLVWDSACGPVDIVWVAYAPIYDESKQWTEVSPIPGCPNLRIARGESSFATATGTVDGRPFEGDVQDPWRTGMNVLTTRGTVCSS